MLELGRFWIKLNFSGFLLIIAMTDETKQAFETYYEIGKNALERGQYRLSVENLEKALEIYPIRTKLGGEVSILLITAYQGVGNLQGAIALCRQLSLHPYPLLREQGQQLLYILEAPRLQRPENWMSKIPPLTADSANSQYLQGKTQKQSSPNSQYEIKPVDLSQVKTEDNRFIWVALLFVLLLIGGTIWLS